MSSLLAALCLSTLAWAFDGNDAFKLELLSGEVVEGWYFRAADGAIVLSGDNKYREIPAVLIRSVTRNEEPMALAAFHAELQEMQRRLDALRADPPRTPAPGLVATASFGLTAGAGHAILGDWKQFWAYTALETVLLGSGAYVVAADQDLGLLLPIGGLTLVTRGYAAGESARRARARRNQIELGGPREGVIATPP